MSNMTLFCCVLGALGHVFGSTKPLPEMVHEQHDPILLHSGCPGACLCQSHCRKWYMGNMTLFCCILGALGHVLGSTKPLPEMAHEQHDPILLHSGCPGACLWQYQTNCRK